MKLHQPEHSPKQEAERPEESLAAIHLPTETK